VDSSGGPPLSCASLAELQHLMMTTDSIDVGAQMAAQYRGFGASSSGAGGSFYPAAGMHLRSSLDLADHATAPGAAAEAAAEAAGGGEKMQPPIKRLIGRRHTTSGSAGDPGGGGASVLATSSRDSKNSADNNSMLLDFFHPHPPSPSSSHSNSGDNNDPGGGGGSGSGGVGGATAAHNSHSNSGDGLAAVGAGTANVKSGGVTFAASVTSGGAPRASMGPSSSSSSSGRPRGPGDADLDHDKRRSGDSNGSGEEMQLNMNINSIFSHDQDPHAMGLGTLSCMSIEDGGGMGVGTNEYNAAAALLKVSSEDWNEPWRNDPSGGGIQLQLPAGARAAAALMASSSGGGGVAAGVAGNHDVLGVLGSATSDGLLGDYDELMQFNFQSASLDILDGTFYGGGQGGDGAVVAAGGAGHLLSRFGGMPPFPHGGGGGMGAIDTDNLTFEQLQLLQHGRGLGIPAAAGLGGKPRLAMVRSSPVCVDSVHCMFTLLPRTHA